MNPSVSSLRFISAKQSSGRVLGLSYQGPLSYRASSRQLSTQSSGKHLLRSASTRSNLLSSISSRAQLIKHQTPAAFAYHRGIDQPRKEWSPPTSDQEVVAHLESVFAPLVFPSNVATRMVTHTSWNDGKEGHNSRLAFLGRRTLYAYLTLFLHSAASRSSTPLKLDYEYIAGRLLEVNVIGQHVGQAWQVQKVMRWDPPKERTDDGNPTGLNKVQGVMVEAIMGGILHQFGGNAAHRAFHTRFLPHIQHLLPPQVQSYANEITTQLGGPKSQLIWESDASNGTQEFVSGVHVTPTEPRRMAAGASA
ncbi:hypothetical protein FRC03_005955 [Tulasnella sp. 419]|nr:hypothetical protein FRC03_005955 [Tulasnella sp. 419]